MSNKDRVFIAIYFRPGITDVESTRSRTQHSKFLWAIWIEPKNSSGEGTSFEVQESTGYATVDNPFGWRFLIQGHKTPPREMLGRIMIGKMPEGMSGSDVAAILRDVPLPSDPRTPVGDQIAWMKAAISELQATGCSEGFSIDQFMDDALSNAKTWMAKDPKLENNEKINYTWSRTFP